MTMRKKKSRKSAASKRRKSSKRGRAASGLIQVPLHDYTTVVDRVGDVFQGPIRGRDGSILDRGLAARIEKLDADSNLPARERDLIKSIIRRSLKQQYGIVLTQAEMALTQKKLAKVVRLLMEDATPDVQAKIKKVLYASKND